MDALAVKLWQAVVSGLSIGSVYALIAQGYYITFITTGTLNFGQGEFLMIGALIGLTCYLTLGLPYALAVLGAIAVAAVMGAGLELLLLQDCFQVDLVQGNGGSIHCRRGSSRAGQQG